MWKLLQVCFLFVHPRKILHSENFLLNLDPTSSIRRIGEFYRQTRTPFKHILKKKKLFNCTVFDERKRQNSEDKGKTYKAKFRHRTRIVLVGHRRIGGNQLFPLVSLGSRKTNAILFCSGGSRPSAKGGGGVRSSRPCVKVRGGGGCLQNIFFGPSGHNLG